MWRIFIIGALLAAAAVTLFVRREHPERLLQLDEAPMPPEPGYFMTDARIVQTGQDGLPLYRMNAERIQQNPANLTIRLQNLRLDYYPSESGPSESDTSESGPAKSDPSEPARADRRRAGARPANASLRAGAQQVDHWTLSAQTGVMPQDATQVELQDNVEIKGQPKFAGAGEPATLRTSKLSVDLQTQVARTRERVDIEWGDRQLSAVGLVADLKAGRVKLESAVHGLFTH